MFTDLRDDPNAVSPWIDGREVDPVRVGFYDTRAGSPDTRYVYRRMFFDGVQWHDPENDNVYFSGVKNYKKLVERFPVHSLMSVHLEFRGLAHSPVKRKYLVARNAILKALGV